VTSEGLGKTNSPLAQKDLKENSACRKGPTGGDTGQGLRSGRTGNWRGGVKIGQSWVKIR